MRSSDVVEPEAVAVSAAEREPDPGPIEDAELQGPPAAPIASLAGPGARARERYRLIARRIDRLLGPRQRRLVVVTSPSPGDGKTTTALNLAITVAREARRRVVLVDADLWRPRLAHALGLTARRGLGEVLRGEAAIEDVLWRMGDEPLWVVPGTPPVDDEPGSIEALAAVAASLRARHDLVLLDAPATSESADAAALGGAADGVLLVVRSGATRREALASALDALVDAPLCGVVLNDHAGPEPGYTRPTLPACRSPAATEEG